MPDFKRVMLGYDPDTVDQALADIDRQFTEANAANKELRLQINNLREQNSEWEKRLKHYEEIEIDLRDALLNAQRIANQIKDEATKQADELRESARKESEAIIAEAARIAKSKQHQAEAMLSEKRTKINKMDEQIRQLAETKAELQALVEQTLGHLAKASELLYSSPLSSERKAAIPSKVDSDQENLGP